MQMEKRIRKASRERLSKETRIRLELLIDGQGRNRISTGFGMLDHMLDLISFWARMDLELRCEGDLEIDAHHTVEDTGLAFGAALAEALGDRAGIARAAFARVPMDEAMADVSIDISGRPWLVWRGDELLPAQIAHEEKDLWREFYKAFATAGRLNLHICFLYGKNGHHLLESAAKGLGMALRQAVRLEGSLLPSTKGVLD